jgi:signal peptidase II
MSRVPHFLVALSIFILDRLSKVLVEVYLPLHQSWTIIPGFFDLAHTRNTGVAFGFLANSDSPWVPWVLTLISSLALVAILAFALRNSQKNWKLQLGLMLVLGGAAGNLYDRLRYGYVIDFIEVYYSSYHWPTFNVADSSISIGIGLLLLETLMNRPRSD